MTIILSTTQWLDGQMNNDETLVTYSHCDRKLCSAQHKLEYNLDRPDANVVYHSGSM